MTSIIPLFILLLTTYSLSAPVGQEYGNSTTGYQYTTGQTFVNMHFTTNNQSTGVPIIQKPRSVEDSDSNEVTIDYVTRPTRAFGQSSIPSSTVSYKKRNDDLSSDSKENENNEKREFKESLIGTPPPPPHYKKRDNEQSEDSKENEKRESVIPTSTTTYKKRGNEQDEDSQEDQSNEKRSLENSEESSEDQNNEKRSLENSEESQENESFDKREPQESLILTSTISYKKRGIEGSEDSKEKQKRESKESLIPTTTHVYKKRNWEDSEESQENESNEKRSVEESSESQENDKRESKEALISLATAVYEKRTAGGDAFTNLDTSKEFNQRAIRPAEGEEEVQATIIYKEKELQLTGDVQPSTSVDSFSKLTGLLNGKQTDSSTDSSTEESTTQSPIQTSQVTETTSTVPQQVGEIKAFINVTTKLPVTIQPMQQEQLSQGQSASVTQKREQDN